MSGVGRLDDELLERSGELAALGGALEAANAGDGALVLVEGPAGIGKTALLRIAERGAGERNMVVLRVGGDQLVAESSFAAIRELFWGEVQGGTASLEGAARLAAPVFAGDSGIVDADRTGAVLHGLYWLLAGVADRAPVVVVLDDAHWLDPASVRFVLYLARRIESLAVLLIVALRGGEAAPGADLVAALSGLAVCVLRLSALSEKASHALVRGIVGPRAGEELCRSCHEVTRGNPFYLRELAAVLKEEPSVATIDPQRVRVLGAGAVDQAVLVRLGGLGSDCRGLASAAALLGPGAPLRHAASLAGLGRHRAESAADRLRAVGMMAAEPSLSFVHPIVGEAIAEQLPESRRAAFHRAAARLLLDDDAPADRVAAHLLSADGYGEPWVVDALQRAGRDAVARGAPEAAAAYLRRALAEPPLPERRLDVFLDLGRVEATLPYKRDYPAYRRALELAADAQQRAEIASELAEAWMAVGEFRLAATLVEDLLRDTVALDPALARRLEADLFAAGASTLSVAPRALARAAPQFDRAIREEIDDPMLLTALAYSGAASGRPTRDVAELTRRALSDGRTWGEWLALRAATLTLAWSDQLDDAGRIQDMAIAESQRRGSAPMFMASAITRAHVAFRAGDVALAEDYWQRGFDLAQQRADYPFVLMWMPAILLERGRARHASDLLEELPLVESLLDLWPEILLLAGRGMVRIALDDLGRGLDDLLGADRRMTAAGLRLSVGADWVPAAVPALVELGRRDQAVRLAEAELADAVRAGAARREGIALSVRGTLDGGEHALVKLRNAVAILGRSPARLEHARALTNLGAGLRAGGRRDEARAPLSQALDIAHRLGATSLADRARRELISTGARPRRAPLSGPEALTAAERRTARMASEGLTNRQIAQALFVSARTVEAQLHQAYRKLRITGRAELAAALHSAAEI
jgi:DNA-binding CsgD family transcriptional regulator/Tfp pilus assembly protein PilF